MRRLTATVTTSFTLLAVTACGGGSQSDPVPVDSAVATTGTPTATPTANATPTLAPNVAAFVERTRELPSFTGGDDTSISTFGLYTCTTLGSADSLGDAFQTILTFVNDKNINVTPEDIASATGFAVGTLCPEHADMLDQ